MNVKKLIAALFITVIACFAMPLTAGAADYTWNDAVTASALTPIPDSSTITISNDSTGQVNFSGETLYVRGDANDLNGDLILNLSGTTKVDWEPKINGTSSGTVTITGSVEYLILTSAEIITDNALKPALTISTVSSVTDISTTASPVLLYNSQIESTGNVALHLDSPARIDNCWWGGGWTGRIQSTAGTAVETTDNLAVFSSTISGVNGIVSTGGRLDVTSPTYTTVKSVGGGNDSGANYAISVTGTAYLTGGTISTDSEYIGRNDPAVYTNGGTIVINGATIDGNSQGTNRQPGVYIMGSGSLSMTSGSVSGYCGLNLSDADKVEITGGTITSNGDGGTAAVDVGGSGTPEVTIGGTANINTATTNAVRVGNSSANLTVTGGNITGYNAGLYLSSFDTITITGGTLDGTDEYSLGINNSTNRNIKIKPTVLTPVLVKSYTQALDENTPGTTKLEDVAYIYTDTDYTGATATEQVNTADTFTNSDTYKYIRFVAQSIIIGSPEPTNPEPTNPTPTNPEPTNPPPTYPGPGVSGPAPGPGVSTPRPGVSGSDSDTSDTSKRNCILVIATLNKYGSVNSTKTVKDIEKAHNRAVSENIDRMYLKIPELGKGISKATMKKVYEAAAGTKLYLIFDYYEAYEVGESEVYGYFYMPVSKNTGQILTGLTFKTKRINTVQSYIKKRWNPEILASFETNQKGGYGVSGSGVSGYGVSGSGVSGYGVSGSGVSGNNGTARLTISLERLHIEKLPENSNLYALIYDTQAKKWYQKAVKIENVNLQNDNSLSEPCLVIETPHTGIVTIIRQKVN